MLSVHMPYRIPVTAIKIAVVCLAGLASWFHWGASAAILCSLLVASVLNLIEGYISIGGALICIGASALLSWTDESAWLQQSVMVSYYAANLGIVDLQAFATTVLEWAFYLLGIGILGHLAQYLCRRSHIAMREQRQSIGVQTAGALRHH